MTELIQVHSVVSVLIQKLWQDWHTCCRHDRIDTRSNGVMTELIQVHSVVSVLIQKLWQDWHTCCRHDRIDTKYWGGLIHDFVLWQDWYMGKSLHTCIFTLAKWLFKISDFYLSWVQLCCTLAKLLFKISVKSRMCSYIIRLVLQQRLQTSQACSIT